MKVQTPVLACRRCGHEWIPRSQDVRICPKCKSARWDQSRGPGTSLLELLRSRRKDILAVCTRHGAGNVRVFGSVAQGRETRESDIDLLVDFSPGRSLMDVAGLKADLEALIGREVDLGQRKTLHPLVRDRVLSEAVKL